MDTILMDRSDGTFFSLEHKTKQGTIDRQWRMEYPLSVQVGTYTHALYCLFPISKVRGVVINGLAFTAGEKLSVKLGDATVPVQCEAIGVGSVTVLVGDTADRRELKADDLTGKLLLQPDSNFLLVTVFVNGADRQEFTGKWVGSGDGLELRSDKATLKVERVGPLSLTVLEARPGTNLTITRID